MSVYTTKIGNIVNTKGKEILGDDFFKLSNSEILNRFSYAPFDFDDYLLPFKDGEPSKNNPDKAAAFKKLLEKCFCIEYWDSEIGFETVALFKMKLNSKLNVVMYRLIPLIEAQTDFFFDEALKSIDVNETEKRTNAINSASSAVNSSDTESKTIGSDTPDNMISIDNIDKFKYASSASYGKGDSKNSSSANSSSDLNEDVTKNRSGYDGINKIMMMADYNNTVKNFIDIIIKECNELFMGVWY